MEKPKFLELMPHHYCACDAMAAAASVKPFCFVSGLQNCVRESDPKSSSKFIGEVLKYVATFSMRIY